jgi:hypothetical protein
MEFMRLAALLLMLCSGTQAFAADMPKKWFKCESSDDCVIAKGACGAATAVNRSYRSAFQKKALTVPCRASVDFKDDKKGKGAGCGLDSKCVTIQRRE